ncbi:hypothetical protein RHSIM_Rhsim10G0132100 [Rhododendron simsii]|uniref:SWIM-type domain-containing protein n=1 Tax=Rhododendron simsii TaxID=118357 RepID=A0A834GFF2_RHOSS|nr:hypothetical protein RHSIM_Rhsim10G0132100 [Rhododendron simsii]
MYQKGPHQTMGDGLVSLTSDKSDDLVDFDDIFDLDKIVQLDEGVIPTGPLEDDEDDDSDRGWECGDEGSDDDNFGGFYESSKDDEEVEQMLSIKIRNEEEELSDQSDDQGCLSNPEDESDDGGHMSKHKLVKFNKDKDMKNPQAFRGHGGTLFEVTSVDKTFMVDIGEHTCTCRRWDLIGIPCIHGCAAIIAHKTQPKDYDNEAYTTDTFVRTYSHRIKPIPDKSLWPQTQCDPIMPPPLRVSIGRPKKARRKGEDEPNNSFKTRKHSTTTMCRQCGQFGHNARFGGGVPPCKPKESGSGSVGRRKGRGRGTRTRTVAVDNGNGRGTVAIDGTVASAKRKAIHQPQQNQGRRLRTVGEIASMEHPYVYFDFQI